MSSPKIASFFSWHGGNRTLIFRLTVCRSTIKLHAIFAGFINILCINPILLYIPLGATFPLLPYPAERFKPLLECCLGHRRFFLLSYRYRFSRAAIICFCSQTKVRTICPHLGKQRLDGSLLSKPLKNHQKVANVDFPVKYGIITPYICH